MPDEAELEIVNVPNIENPLSDQDYAELCNTISPYANTENFGMDIYLNVLNYVCQKQ